MYSMAGPSGQRAGSRSQRSVRQMCLGFPGGTALGCVTKTIFFVGGPPKGLRRRRYLRGRALDSDIGRALLRALREGKGKIVEKGHEEGTEARGGGSWSAVRAQLGRPPFDKGTITAFNRDPPCPSAMTVADRKKKWGAGGLTTDRTPTSCSIIQRSPITRGGGRHIAELVAGFEIRSGHRSSH